MAGRNDDGVGFVEFIDNEDGTVDHGGPIDLGALFTRWRPLAEAVAALGEVGAMVCVFLPQLVVRFGTGASYEVDGFGRYRVLVADPGAVLVGHAPPLGVVGLVAGGLLLIVVGTVAAHLGCPAPTAHPPADLGTSAA